MPRHENPEIPENRSESGNLSMYERWLAGQMTEVLVDCTKGAQARQFGFCDLDGEYPALLDKYVDVARETETTQDDEAVDAFKDAKENQHDFNEEVATFWRTYEAYQEARNRGDTARSRRLAHRLGRLASAINETSGSLSRDYRRISNTTRFDHTDARTTVDNVIQNITMVVRDAQSDVLVATILTVQANETEISFLKPLVVSGRLSTENGSVIANRTIRVDINGRTFQTRTEEYGPFGVTYRPTTLPLNTTRVTVQYVPRNESVYQSSLATLPVTIEHVEPSVTVSQRPRRVGFGDTVVVNGSVSADGIGAPSVPVRISFAGGNRTMVTTGPEGGYSVQFAVPAEIPDGDHQIKAEVPLDGQALGHANATTTVTVQRTDTRLTLNGSHAGTDQIRVRGHLATVDDEQIGGQPIRVTINGTTVGTVRTGADGRYATTVTVPQRLLTDRDSNPAVRVETQFEARGTNLKPTQDALLLRVPRKTTKGADAQTSLRNLRETIGAVMRGQIEDITDELATWSVWQVVVAAVGVALLLMSLVLAWLKRAPIRKYLDPLFIVGGRLWRALWYPLKVPVRVLQSGAIAAVLMDGPVLSYLGMTDKSETDTDVDEASEAPPQSAHRAADAEPVSPLERAQQQLETGDTDTAVQTAYVLTREHLATVVETPPSATPREFYDLARDRLSTEQDDALRRLTEAYEAAVFSPTPVGADTALTALNAAERFDGEAAIRDGGGGQKL